jgi:yersiniabactin synthetase, thiazolinyl reductase component
MKRLRVLVCGTNYGQMYVQAVKEAPRVFELAGILASGSTRSRQLARAYRVPLYRTVEDLAQDVDIACAAMGASGTDAILRLLERGIHVLCEHPQKPDYIEVALRSAASSGACFHVNGHFASLKAASAFIKHCNLLRQSTDPSFIDVWVTDRSLYATLDILRRVTRTFEGSELALHSDFPPFTVVQGTLGAVPATFQVQRSRKKGQNVLRDGDPSYLVDFRIATGFPSGVLTLLSIAGPVIWSSNYARSSGVERPMWTSIYGKPTTSSDLHEQRVIANLDAVHCLLRSAREHVVPPEQTPRHILEVSLMWERIGTLVNG